MRFEERELPRNYNTGMREMMEEEEDVMELNWEEDIVELNWEDVEQITDDWSQPVSSEEEKEEQEEDMDMPIVDDATQVLTGHSRSVFCCAFHPNSMYAITGGEDDKAIIWKLSTNNPVSVLSHYKDSVCEVGFSFDGNYVAIADMMGDIEVYRTDGDLQLTKVWSERIEEVQWIEWHKQAHVLMAGGLGTSVYMWKIPSGECKVFSGECSSPTGSFMPDGKRAVVAYRNGAVRVFNLVSGETTCWFKEKDWNISEVISLAVHPNNNVAVVGDTLGNIALFTTQAPSKIVKEFSFKGQNEGRGGDDVYCIENLMFSQDSEVSSLLVTTSRGLFVWDYVRQVVKKYIGINPGITKIVAVGDSDHIAVGTTSGSIALVDIKQGVIVRTLTGHADTILSLAVTRDKKHLLTTSDDTTVRLFSLTDNIEAT